MPTLLRESTARNFLKDLTDMRIGDDAVDLLIQLVTPFVEKLAHKAAALAKDVDRTTILDDDIQAAFDDQFKTTVSSLLDPASIHQSIGQISTDDLKALIKLLMKDLE